MERERLRPLFALRAAWTGLLILTVALWLVPVRFGVLRLFLAFALPALTIGAAALLWRRKWLRVAPLGIIAVCGTVVALPGRDCDAGRLRSEYTRCLKRYQGVTYFWGGETRLGIDCSGFVRKGLIDANARLGLRTLNGRLIRSALDLWWHDLSARALRDEHQDRTRRLFEAETINGADHERLLSGDLAVTASGVHVLVYVGNREWMQADPGFGKVICDRVPSENPWFGMPVHFMRWTQLEGAAHDR